MSNYLGYDHGEAIILVDEDGAPILGVLHVMGWVDYQEFLNAAARAWLMRSFDESRRPVPTYDEIHWEYAYWRDDPDRDILVVSESPVPGRRCFQVTWAKEE